MYGNRLTDCKGDVKGHKVFTCDRCHKPIHDLSDGVVQHSIERNFPAPDGERPTKPVYNLDELNAVAEYDENLERSQYGMWEVGHYECLDPIMEDYWIDLRRCDTPVKVLSWTAHLAGKSAFPVFRPQDWADLLNRHFGKEIHGCC